MSISRIGINIAHLVARNTPMAADSKALFMNARRILDNASLRTLAGQLNSNLGKSQTTLVTSQTYNKLQKFIPKRMNISKTRPYQETHAFLRPLSGQLNSDLGKSKRTLVTSQTYNELQKIIPKKIDISKVPPYQETSLCGSQAKAIVIAKVKEAQREASSSSSQPEEVGLAKFLKQVKTLWAEKYDIEQWLSPDDLLARFNEKGILILRGPGLGELYLDHTVTVFSANKINVPGKGPRIVMGIIDCNDRGTDPETKASWKALAKLNKLHPSELTHEEANQNGAHLRRIRFVDATALGDHVSVMTERYFHLIMDKVIPPPEIIFPKEKIPSLTPDESEKLSKILVEIYDTPEVEKEFGNISDRRLEHNAERRAKDSAMSQQLHKAMAKKD